MTTTEAVRILVAIFPNRYVTAQVEAKRYVTDPPKKLTYTYGVYIEREKEQSEQIPSWFYSDVSLEEALLLAMKHFFWGRELVGYKGLISLVHAGFFGENKKE